MLRQMTRVDAYREEMTKSESRLLRGYVVRGGEGTAFFGYAWTRGKHRLVRATEDGAGQLIVKRFDPTGEGRMRAHIVAMAIGGTVKRVMRRARTTA